MGFVPSKDDRIRQTDTPMENIEALKAEAEEEWHEIRNAFHVLEDHFGPDFSPLGPEFSAPIHTPFGTALNYRTYGIAAIVRIYPIFSSQLHSGMSEYRLISCYLSSLGHLS